MGRKANQEHIISITESTLRTHLRNIYGKTQTHSRAELISMLETRVRGL